MNERNVEAIYELLSEAHTELLAYAGEQDQVHRTAAFLAARGCLVPSAMSDEEARSAIDGGADVDLTAGGPTEYDFAWFRAELERIAKGEGPGGNAP